MNEFTIQELNFIHEMIRKYQHADLTIYNEVFNKIQFLIDSYCEHECNGEVEVFIDTCSKCKSYLLRETHHEEFCK